MFIIVILFFGGINFSHLFANMSNTPSINPHQVLIHFKHIPNDEHHHKHLSKVIIESLDHINTILENNGYIAPDLTLPAHAPWLNQLWYRARKIYYASRFNLYSSIYPNRLNRVFFTRQDKDFGVYTMYIPDGVPYAVFIDFLNEWYVSKGVDFHVEIDKPLQLMQQSPFGLEGCYLTLQQVDALALHETMSGSVGSLAPVQNQKNLAEQVTRSFLWHQKFPTVGMIVEKKPTYPFIPHWFSLWQLAPKKGRGIKIAVIDTGVAAFEVIDQPNYKKNINLNVAFKPGEHNFNIVSDYGLDPLEQTLHFIEKFIMKGSFNEENLEIVLPDWIKQYLLKQDSTAIEKYLVDNGFPSLRKGTALTTQGKAALQQILTGNLGFHPANNQTTKPFNVVQLLLPEKKHVIQQFLPAPLINSDITTFVAGHGSHTFGIIAAKKDENDRGISGLAPQALTFAIKAFQDNGKSDKSTLIAALKKAIVHDADIVNLSLKIANVIDMSEPATQLLERILGLLPYVVAASGNDGDPQSNNFPGRIESYPAKFDNVSFDVGAFDASLSKPYVPSFSQYEPDVGPLILAPGFNILSTGIIPNQLENSMYVFMGGTSMAAPMMSGFLALMLAEFGDIFSREQILKICYAATVDFFDTSDWREKTMRGVIDMRTALFCAHALQYIKNQMKIDKVNYDFIDHFDHLLQSVLHILFLQVNLFAQEQAINYVFQRQFVDFMDSIQNSKIAAIDTQKYFVPAESDLQGALQFIYNSIRVSIDKNYEKKPQALPPIIDDIRILLNSKSVDIFGRSSKAVKKRIFAHEKIDPYWFDKARKLKEALSKQDADNTLSTTWF